MEVKSITGEDDLEELDPEISMFTDMGIRMEDIFKHVKRRLDEDWVIMVGDPEFIDTIESTVYPTDKEAGKGLEILTIDPPLYLVKKTAELRVYLRAPDVFDKAKVMFAHRERLTNDAFEDKIFLFPPDINSDMNAEAEGFQLVRDMLEIRFVAAEAIGK